MWKGAATSRGCDVLGANHTTSSAGAARVELSEQWSLELRWGWGGGICLQGGKGTVASLWDWALGTKEPIHTAGQGREAGRVWAEQRSRAVGSGRVTW